MNNILEDKNHIHFIGIGGSGMFPLAQILHENGYFLTGSDNNESDTLNLVRNLGINVFMGHKAENLEGVDLVVYSAAIMKTNPELKFAIDNNIVTVERSVLLGFITSCYKNTYGISGTHGKTTVSSILTQIFIYAKKDPTAVIGGKLPLIGGNGRVGKTELLVCESCEYVDTFLKLFPDVAVILNIDADHLEYFKTMDNLILSFEKFASKATKMVVYNGDDENTKKAIADIKSKKISFGFCEHNNYYAKNIEIINGKSHFDIYKNKSFFLSISLHIPGKYNILNTLAAICCADLENVSKDVIQKAVSDFGGAGRRFERLGVYNDITIVDDYAHHPSELEVTLNAAKELGYNNVWAIFQPFTFSRTYMLLDDFARVLKIADKVILAPIMGSREINTYNISSSDLASKIENSIVIETFQEIADYIKNNAKKGDLVITLGCGDIYKAAKLILK